MPVEPASRLVGAMRDMAYRERIKKDHQELKTAVELLSSVSEKTGGTLDLVVRLPQVVFLNDQPPYLERKFHFEKGRATLL